MTLYHILPTVSPISYGISYSSSSLCTTITSIILQLTTYHHNHSTMYHTLYHNHIHHHRTIASYHPITDSVYHHYHNTMYHTLYRISPTTSSTSFGISYSSSSFSTVLSGNYVSILQKLKGYQQIPCQE